jgi:ABC-type transporter Mla MlaB component
VVYLVDPAQIDDVTARLLAADPDVGPALAERQLELRCTHDAYLPDGRFETERMVAYLRKEHRRALAEGHRGLSCTGDMSWALTEAPGCDGLVRYERSLETLAGDTTLRMLCQYDHARFDAGVLSEIASAHGVDVSPDLAPIVRDDYFMAARVGPTGMLRLVGELDFDGADTLASVLASLPDDELRVDLADLTFIDVAGMRALRRRSSQRLDIVDAPELVRRLMGLLAWDTDPRVSLVEAT